MLAPPASSTSRVSSGAFSDSTSFHPAGGRLSGLQGNGGGVDRATAGLQLLDANGEAVLRFRVGWRDGGGFWNVLIFRGLGRRFRGVGWLGCRCRLIDHFGIFRRGSCDEQRRGSFIGGGRVEHHGYLVGLRAIAKVELADGRLHGILLRLGTDVLGRGREERSKIDGEE